MKLLASGWRGGLLVYIVLLQNNSYPGDRDMPVMPRALTDLNT